jgi:hypothetical protein
MLGMAGMLRSGVANPRFMYLPINRENEGARAFAPGTGATCLPELDCRLAGHTIEYHRIDHGPGGLFGALRHFAYQELGLTEPDPLQAAVPTVDRQIVRDALRHFHVPPRAGRQPAGARRHAAGAGRVGADPPARRRRRRVR